MEININRKNFFKAVSVTILIIGLIVGVICGNEIPVRSMDMAEISSALALGKTPDFGAVDESFNTVLMLTIWCSSVLLSIFFYGIHSILHALYLFIYKLYGTSDLDAIDAIYEPIQSADDFTSAEQ